MVLGDEVDDSPERYSFTWNGKKQAMKLAQQPTIATLRPNKKKSKNWDETQNLYVEGDNLEVLKILQKSYASRIKMIYVDPPYNTGKDFVYKDNFYDSMQNYLKQTGQVDSEGNKLSVNTETSGRYHTDWLNMMYPRLKLARNLLKEDGVIFISIDENEMSNIEKILSEIFGEQNFGGVIVWDKRNPKGDTKGVAMQHEYILVAMKDINKFAETTDFRRLKKNATAMLAKANQLVKKVSMGYSISDANNDYKKWVRCQEGLSGGERAYDKIDKHGNVYQEVSMAAPDKPEKRSHRPLIHPTTDKQTAVPEKGWRYTDTSMDLLLDQDLIIFGKDETTIPRKKYLLKDNLYENVPSLYYNGASGSSDVTRLDMKASYFDNPKLVDMLCQFIQSTTKDDIVIDFFSGSGTTADAVMQQNVADLGNRRYILVQLPESIDEKQEAYKDGYRTIPEIAEERIRRAGDKIVSKNPELKNKLDIGFKVFELSNSNIKKWNADTVDLNDQIEMQIENIQADTNNLDLVYEIMLKQGLDLSLPIEEINVDEAVIYKVAYGALFIVLGNNIKSDVATEIINIIKFDELEEVSIVLQDSGFENDSEKLNSIEILNAGGVDYNDILSI